MTSALEGHGWVAQAGSYGAQTSLFMRGDEIYDHLEKSVDRFDDIANQIQAIVIEHV